MLRDRLSIIEILSFFHDYSYKNCEKDESLDLQCGCKKMKKYDFLIDKI